MSEVPAAGALAEVEGLLARALRRLGGITGESSEDCSGGCVSALLLLSLLPE